VSELTTISLGSREPEVTIRTVPTFDRAVDDFLGDCHRRGFTERTIRAYKRTYDEFSEVCHATSTSRRSRSTIYGVTCRPSHTLRPERWPASRLTWPRCSSGSTWKA
jgi:hypothetical protein